MDLILGIIIGLLIAIINVGLWIRFHIPLQRKMDEIMNKPIFSSGENRAYIAGLSDEESTFAASLDKKHDVKLT